LLTRRKPSVDTASLSVDVVTRRATRPFDSWHPRAYPRTPMTITPRLASAMAMALLLWSPNGRAETTPPSDRVEADSASAILTPPAPASPRINSPSRFGVRPGSPFFYRIPASGVRPLEFSAQNLPAGLTLDSKTGIIRGVLSKSGSIEVLLSAKNAAGSAEK
jgi:hypothetical protein